MLYNDDNHDDYYNNKNNKNSSNKLKVYTYVYYLTQSSTFLCFLLSFFLFCFLFFCNSLLWFVQTLFCKAKII